ncbi:MAG TPA: hypothetical protein VFQ58_07460 [Flavisolibacter sp.]|nr:hypothetical protein [Flavisolibacter sp.]
MKTSYFLSLSVLLFLLSCNSVSNNKIKKVSPVVKSKIDNKSIISHIDSSDALAEYRKFVSSLDTLDVSNSLKAANKYQQLLFKENSVSKERAFLTYYEFYEALERNLIHRHDEDTTNYEILFFNQDSTGKKLPEPSRLVNYKKHLLQNGFQLTFSIDGNVSIERSLDFIIKWFYPFVSEEMREYIKQLNKENKEGFVDDGGIVIDPKQYIDRIIKWEKFASKFPTFIFIDRIVEEQHMLLTYLLEGIDNTPLMDEDNKMISEYYSTAYNYLQKTFPNSKTNDLVHPYYIAVLQKNKIMQANLLDNYRKKGIIDF